MQLVFLLALLLIPYLLLTIANRFRKITAAKRARAGLSLFFLFTGIGHFIRTDEMSAMLPPAVGYRTALIYFSGVLELLGAIGVWIPGLTRVTGVCLILLLLAVLPANVYSAMNHVDFGGHGAGPAYLLVRGPFQIFVIAWTYFATEQHWFRKEPKAA